MSRPGSGSHKRRKISHEQLLPSGNIRGAFELHNLLRFRQNGGPEARAGVDEFKKFCKDIQFNDNADERQVQLKVLKQYCDEQSSAHGEDLDFTDLLSTWSYAAQSNNESILSAVPAALSQFFRTISTELDFRDFGLSLSQTLLKRDQLKLIERNLTSPKHKDFLISPCLRLLTEVVSLDGGAMVGSVFSRRDVLLKRLDTLLDPPPQKEDTDRQKPTVRSNALRLIIALLKYLDDPSREEFISQAKLPRPCFEHLSSDHSLLVKGFLDTIRIFVIDSAVSKDAKKRLFNSNNLSAIAALYEYEEEKSEEPRIDVREEVHHFLIHACTSSNGVCISGTGWLPVGFKSERPPSGKDNFIDLGLDSPYYSDDYSSSVPIRNTTLSTFLQRLTPAKDTLHAGLIVKIFEAAPELVADYFCRNSNAIDVPKESDPAWRGQIAFLRSVISLPLPKDLRQQVGMPSTSPMTTPAPLSIMLENIFPRQLSRTALNQCLKSDDEIIVIGSAAVMKAALQKLRSTLKIFRANGHDLWSQAALQLRDMMSSRLPAYSELITAFQQTAARDSARAISLLECMATYHEANIPSSPFDIGPAILQLLQELETSGQDDVRNIEEQIMASLRLAAASKSCKWWHKPGAQGLCPLMRTIRYIAGEPTRLSKFRSEWIVPVLTEAGIISSENAYKVLLDSLSRSHNPPEPSVCLFLENCMLRVSKQPVKYMDMADGVSPLASCIVEQWAFVEPEDKFEIGLAALLFLAGLKARGENAQDLKRLEDALLSSENASTKAEIVKTFNKLNSGLAVAPPYPSPSPSVSPTGSQQEPLLDESDGNSPAASSFTSFIPPPPIPDTLRCLTSWSKVDFESLLSVSPATSSLASLFLCLSSHVSEIHLTAYQTLLSLLHAISTSTYSEKDQLYLLIGELTETSHTHSFTSTTPLPTLVPSLAIFLLSIITNPADPMYSIANKYLMLAPSWPINRIIPYWTNIILLSEPESDDANASQSVQNHYLDMLISGLRTAEDMDLYRKSGIFERVCSLYLAPATKKDTKMKILHLMYQAINAGGADTLITRVGVEAWFSIVAQRALADEVKVVKALKQLLEQQCSKEYIATWKQDRPLNRHKAQEDIVVK